MVFTFVYSQSHEAFASCGFGKGLKDFLFNSTLGRVFYLLSFSMSIVPQKCTPGIWRSITHPQLLLWNVYSSF